MRVEFAFDEKALRKDGYSLQNICNTVKTLFAEYDLPCVEEGDRLIFKGRDGRDDFAHLWLCIIALIRSRWFLTYATACEWFGDDAGDDEGEDVLAIAWKFRT